MFDLDATETYVEAAHVPPCADAVLVRSGLLTAFAVQRDGRTVLLPPLAYDLDIVRDDGTYLVPEGYALEDAVTDWYGESFQGWCDRKEAEREALRQATVDIPRRRSLSGCAPTADHAGRFVPFSWMGRHPSFVR